MVVIEMENGKKIELELYPEIAPITCENFEKLVKQGFYNGLIFHRVIPGFMIQGGVRMERAWAARAGISRANLLQTVSRMTSNTPVV